MTDSNCPPVGATADLDTQSQAEINELLAGKILALRTEVQWLRWTLLAVALSPWLGILLTVFHV